MYQTLYRKYRPRKFNEIVGQDVIIKTLKNSILHNRVSHAYLFIGPRGTGKTTSAKVFSSAVNCLNNNSGDLCDECLNCKVSSDKDCLDIIEIDAASNNGVDEIRNLREKVVLVPSELKYKVYIIDEVHMLTISAFNALLKTLEEPPEHVIFILATTDPQKIPETIISRCQCYNFSRISDLSIVEYLKKVCAEEKFNCDLSVLENIAISSDGGMRDSLGMLDKLSSYKNGDIILEDFLLLNGLVTDSDLDCFLSNILDNNISNVVNLLDTWNLIGKNIIQVMVQFLNFLKNKLVDLYINDANSIDIIFLQKLANLINEKLYDIKRSSSPKIYIEIMLLDYINANTISSNKIDIASESIVSHETINKNSDANKIVNLDNDIEVDTNINFDKDKSDDNIRDISDSNIKDIMNIRVNNAFINAKKEFLNNDKQKFELLNDYTFNTDIGYLVCALLDGKLRLSNDNYLVISYEYESSVMENLANLQEMERVLNELLLIEKKLVIITDDEWQIFANQYINNKKDNISYSFINEPKLMFEKKDDSSNNLKNNEDNDSVSSIFGDIVEVY